MKETQHYVPQLMLRRFARKHRKRHREVHHIWVKDLKDERAYVAAVPDVAAGRGFYSPRTGGPDANWLEEQLARIENLAAQALARLIEPCNWQAHTEEDRITLAIFLITLYSRGPRTRRNLAEMPGQILEHFKAIGEKIAPELQRELEAAQASDPVPDHAGVIIETAKNYPALVERSWWLLIPPIGSRFICSDCPVLMENPLPDSLKSNMGLLVTGVILYLPLSPYLMLMVADSVHGLADRQVRHIGPQEFRYMQWLTGLHTERFIYGRSAEDLIVTEGSWLGGRRPEIVSPLQRPQR